MANHAVGEKVNESFSQNEKTPDYGMELNSTVVSVPLDGEKCGESWRQNDSDNLLKLAVVVIVILVITVVVTGVLFAKEVRGSDDSNEEAITSKTTRKPTTLSLTTPSLRTCFDDNCVVHAAGCSQRSLLIRSFSLYISYFNATFCAQF